MSQSAICPIERWGNSQDFSKPPGYNGVTCTHTPRCTHTYTHTCFSSLLHVNWINEVWDHEGRCVGGDECAFTDDKNTTASIITSMENPRIKTFNTKCYKRSLYNVKISHFTLFYGVKLWFRLLLLRIQMCWLIICAYCSGSEGWRAGPPHVSAGPAESPQWSCGHPAASSAVPCRSDVGSQPGSTDLPESQIDLPVE